MNSVFIPLYVNQPVDLPASVKTAHGDVLACSGVRQVSDDDFTAHAIGLVKGFSERLQSIFASRHQNEIMLLGRELSRKFGAESR